MKKFIFLLGAVYVFTFISFKEPTEKPMSFSQIIKNDPSRIKELLEVASSLNENQNQKIDSPDAINNDSDIIKDSDEINTLRKNQGIRHDKYWPVIKVAASEMQEIIGNPATINPVDTLFFYLITFKEKKFYPHRKDSLVDVRMARYNTRNNGNGNIKINDLSNRPSFLIKNFKPSNNQLLLANTLYNVGTICPPPPGGGCN